MTKRVGRPSTGTNEANYQKWKDRTKTCSQCAEKKKINEFPYGHGTYQKSEVCKACNDKKKEAGYFFGNAYIPKGKRLPKNHPIFKPTRIKEQDLDPLAQHILNNEGAIIDFEE